MKENKEDERKKRTGGKKQAALLSSSTAGGDGNLAVPFSHPRAQGIETNPPTRNGVHGDDGVALPRTIKYGQKALSEDHRQPRLHRFRASQRECQRILSEGIQHFPEGRYTQKEKVLSI